MTRSLTSLVLTVALTGSLSLVGGCVVRGQAGVAVEQPTAVVEVDEEPPPAQVEVEVSQPRAGFVWIQGHHVRAHGHWEWHRGYWERERANQAWEAGRWERRGNRHVWIEGHWARHEGPIVRDHR